MSISNNKSGSYLASGSRVSIRKLAVEAALTGSAATAIALLASSSSGPWMHGTSVHPGWIAVLALAGFYGLRGLIIAAPIVWMITGAVSLAVGSGLAGAERLVGGTDLMLLAASLGVAAIAMVHTRSRRALEDETHALRARCQEEAELVDGLQGRVLELAARNERIDLSVRFWRDIASRLESMSPASAASAALEMCLARTGARAGIIRRVEGNSLRNLAARGRWSSDSHFAGDIFADATISAAMATEGLILATDVEGASPADSDAAVAIRCADTGAVLGVMALRGLIHSKLGLAEAQDLQSMADWLTMSLAVREEHRDPAVGAGAQPEPLAPARKAPQLLLVEADA